MKAKLEPIGGIALPFSVILMEAFAVYPWLEYGGNYPGLGWGRAPLGLVSIILLMTVSFFVTRYPISRQWSLRVIQVLTVLLGLLAVFVAVRSEYATGFELLGAAWFVHVGEQVLATFSAPAPILLAPLFGFFFWWRGISRARSLLHPDDLYRAFAIGVAAQSLLAVFAGLSPESSGVSGRTLALFIAAFFFFGLAAIALSHLTTISYRIGGPASRLQNGNRWLVVVLVVVAGMVLAGFVLASVFSPSTMDVLVTGFGKLYDLLVTVIQYLLIPVGLLLGVLIWIGQWLLARLRGQETPDFEAPLGDPGKDLQLNPTGSLPESLIVILKWVALAAVLIVVLFFLYKAVARRRVLNLQDGVEEIHESLFSWSGLRNDVRLLLNAIFRRFRPVKKAEVAEAGYSFHAESEEADNLSVREIYRRFLLWASYIQTSRRDSETPREYAVRLAGVVPDSSESLDELTDLYVNVRYGERQADVVKTTRANTVWKKLRGMLGKTAA